jgi:acetylornithine deacetylase/succinyl-diaminopimelate desuccinylase-like protein
VRPIDLVRDLIRLRTVNPPGDEALVASALESYLADAGLETEILVSPRGRTNLVARLAGPRDRPALVLLSHSDVVPVEEARWSRDPFAADIVDGVLWGRGALDMKGIAVMHAVAAAALARSGRPPTREVIVVVAADEEAAGGEGARWLVAEHAAKVGFAEGQPPPEVISEGSYGLSGMLRSPVVPIALGEKTAVWFEILCQGDPGHGALPPRHQAAVNMAALVGEVGGFGKPRVHPLMREQFAAIAPAASGSVAAVLRALASPVGTVVAGAVAAQLRKASALGLLLSDSVTPTTISAGYKANVVPGEARVSFDSRLLPDTDVEAFLAGVERAARRRGGRVVKVVQAGSGPVSERGPLYPILEKASRQLAPGAIAGPTISPVITDLRFFRARGATGYGWCPLVLTPELLTGVHGHDERVPVADFERGVQVTSEVVMESAT